MKYVYCIRDRLSGTFLPPIFAPEGKDDFVRAHVYFCLHNPAKAFEQHLECAEICFLGIYDETDASFSLVEKPEVLQDLGPVCEQAKARLSING